MSRSSCRNRRRRLGNVRRWRKVRRKVLKRDLYMCQMCGGLGYTVDHIQRLSEGGAPFDMANLWTLCSRCHRTKDGSVPRPKRLEAVAV